MSSLVPFIKLLKARKASRVNLQVGAPPTLQVSGEAVPVAGSPTLTKEMTRKLVLSFLNSKQIEQLTAARKLSLKLQIKDVGRFRAQVLIQNVGFSLSITDLDRLLPPESVEEPQAATEPESASSPPPAEGADAEAAPKGEAEPLVATEPEEAAEPETAREPEAGAGVAEAASEPGAAAAVTPPAEPRPAPPEAAAEDQPETTDVRADGAGTAQQGASPAPETEGQPSKGRAEAVVSPTPPAGGEAQAPAAAPLRPVPPPRAAPAAGTVSELEEVFENPFVVAHPYRDGDIRVDELLAELLDKNGSDLHMHVGKVPLIRVSGKLMVAKDQVIDEYNMLAIIESLTNEEERLQYARNNDLDTAYNLKGQARFRVNILNSTAGRGGVLRMIPFKIPDYKDLGVPEAAHELIFRPHGLFLVTGPTGSGKSTTLASLLADVNNTQYKHIITIEDPVEFIHNDIKSSITQREVGTDTRSFAEGVISVLRQDPDIILVGEMRDIETMSAALVAAEAGRLVLATLHTTSAFQTVERIINVFPEEQQSQARIQLAQGLVGILSQALLPRRNGGRIAAFEVMIATDSIRNLIKENKPFMIQTSIETGAKYGMQSLDQHLIKLLEDGEVSFEDAYAKCQNPKAFKAAEARLRGVSVAEVKTFDD